MHALLHIWTTFPIHIESFLLRSVRVCVCMCWPNRTSTLSRSNQQWKYRKCFNALYFKFQLFTFCCMCGWFRLFFFRCVVFPFHTALVYACFFSARFGRFYVECSHQVNGNKSWWFISLFVCFFFISRCWHTLLIRQIHLYLRPWLSGYMLESQLPMNFDRFTLKLGFHLFRLRLPKWFLRQTP